MSRGSWHGGPSGGSGTPTSWRNRDIAALWAVLAAVLIFHLEIKLQTKDQNSNEQLHSRVGGCPEGLAITMIMFISVFNNIDTVFTLNFVKNALVSLGSIDEGWRDL